MKAHLERLLRPRGVLPLVTAAILALAGVAAGGELREPGTAPDAGTIQVHGAWARPGLPGGTSAAYFVLVNRGSAAVQLVGATSSAARETEIHRTVLEERPGPDGTPHQVMRMEPAGTLVLPPGAELVFEPGGLHVMFLHLTEPLAAGDRVHLTLLFDGADPITLDLPVLPPGELGPAMGHGH
ncbi:MAG TPA: copper chaperone PCu(A)C [Limnochorda sp.]